MKRLSLMLMVSALVVFGSGGASAGILNLLGTPPNSVNDLLSDKSWGIEIGDEDPVDNVIFGVARVDSVSVNGPTPSLLYPWGSAWLVFSVTRSGQELKFQDSDGYLHTPTTLTGYTLQTLAGIPDTVNNALLVLFDGANPSSSALALTPGTAAGYDQLINAISYLKDNAVPVAAFGIQDTQDFFWAESVSLPAQPGKTLDEFFALSVVWTNPSTQISNFKALFAQDDQLVDLTKYEFALSEMAQVTVKKPPEALPVNVVGYYTDSVNAALLNYVPEPTSVVALLGLGSVALASYVARRRKS